MGMIPHCAGCQKRDARIRDLEDDVVRFSRELAMMRAALRMSQRSLSTLMRDVVLPILSSDNPEPAEPR